MDTLTFELGAAGLVLGFLAIAVGLAIWWYRARSELRFREYEVRHRILEKFADSEAFLTFARSEEGRRLLLAAPEATRNGRSGALRLLQVGLLVLALGIGARMASADFAASSEPFD